MVLPCWARGSAPWACWVKNGGDACESNTPGALFTPHDGFEDRGAHQDSSTSTMRRCAAYIVADFTPAGDTIFEMVLPESRQRFASRQNRPLCLPKTSQQACYQKAEKPPRTAPLAGGPKGSVRLWLGRAAPTSQRNRPRGRGLAKGDGSGRWWAGFLVLLCLLFARKNSD